MQTFRHNLLISIRNFRKHKASFLINLAGLSSGLACALLCFLWVNDELAFDRFHPNDDRLWQVMELSHENNKPVVHTSTQGPLGAVMQKDLPEVQEALQVMNLQKENIYASMRVGDKVVQAAPMFAGLAFFRLFNFPLVTGDPKQALAGKNNIVISEQVAKSLFGSATDAMGKQVKWELTGLAKEGIVSGVFRALPFNSSLQFDMVATEDLLINEIWTNGQYWWNEGMQTYLLMKPGTEPVTFNSKIRDFIKKYYPETNFQLFTRPFSSGYLYGSYQNGKQEGGRITYVRLFSLIALFIVVIACINFMNLATARASRRLKEIGIKKTMGSTRGMLIRQFLLEAQLMSFLALTVAMVLVLLLLPLFNEVTGRQLALHFSLSTFLMLTGATCVAGLLAGSYPAFYLSGFNPIAVLKGKLKNTWGEMLARKGLVVFQFSISMTLIVAALIIYRQMRFIQSADPGYDREHVIYFDKEGRVNQDLSGFLAGLRNIPGVVRASAIQESVVYQGGGTSTYGIDWPGKRDKELIDFVVRAVDLDMVETLDMRVKEGRSFSGKFGADSTNILVNETAVNVMGLKNPVGTVVRWWGKDKTIIGVLKDFHVSSFHDAVYPTAFYYDPGATFMVMARLDGRQEKEALQNVAAYYKKFNPGYLFNYKFLDQAYQAQYTAEQRVSVLSRYFAGLAILISCLGLFGLAAFNAEVRTKEVGIRKALGASASQVAVLLSRDYFKLVLIACCLAFPAAWWAMENWLNGFAYRVSINATVFVAALLAVVLLTLLTVGYQAIRSALENPATSLRSE